MPSEDGGKGGGQQREIYTCKCMGNRDGVMTVTVLHHSLGSCCRKEQEAKKNAFLMNTVIMI